MTKTAQVMERNTYTHKHEELQQVYGAINSEEVQFKPVHKASF
jgi:hypothetical protein